MIKDMKKFKVVASILTKKPLESLIQLIDNLRSGQEDLAILLHINIEFDYQKTVADLKKHYNNPDWLFINSQQCHTAYGSINNGLLSNFVFAINNIDFDYYLILPFNCLKFKTGLLDYIKNNPADLYMQKDDLIWTLGNKLLRNGEMVKHYSGLYFSNSPFLKLLMKNYSVNGNFCIGQHEGLMVSKKLAEKIVKKINIKFWRIFFSYYVTLILKKVNLINFYKLINKLGIKNDFSFGATYVFGFEEVFWPNLFLSTVLNNQMLWGANKICFVNWENNRNADLNLINDIKDKINGSYFYKWVSTDFNDRGRQEIINSLIS